MADSHLIGIFARANSNGIALSNLASDDEVSYLRSLNLDIKIGVVESRLNAIGNNVLANDKIALINSEYSHEDMKSIRDILDVEVVQAESGGFKTIGANNILTNKGCVLNNRSTRREANPRQSMRLRIRAIDSKHRIPCDRACRRSELQRHRHRRSDNRL